MTYIRVLPRDAFNEASLLKCIGALTLVIHNYSLDRLTFDHDGEPFDVCQNEYDGSLYVDNVTFKVNGQKVEYFRPLNSRGSYPLVFIIDDVELDVFNNDGTLSQELCELIEFKA